MIVRGGGLAVLSRWPGNLKQLYLSQYGREKPIGACGTTTSTSHVLECPRLQLCPFKLNIKAVPSEFFSLNFSFKVTFLI